MASFETDDRGGIDDRVRLELDGEEVLIAETYEVTASILSQPARFSLRLGHGGVAKDLLRRYKPNTPFALRIGSVLQQTGRTDGYHADQTAGATEITVFGRDALAPVHDGEIELELTFAEDTYATLAKKALEFVGLDPSKLKHNADADRKLRTGVPVSSSGEPTADPTSLAVGRVQRAIKTHIGETWFSFLRRYYDRAGLFFWGGVDGTPILSGPNTKQPPIARILRRRGQTRNEVNVVRAAHGFDTSRRHSAVTVYGRAAGRKFGRGKVTAAHVDGNGAVVDEEIQNKPVQNNAGEWVSFGIQNRVRTVRDANVHTTEQAEFLADRLIAEERRESWRLEYTLAGHTYPSLINGGGRGVWAPDTVVEVHDDEFGIDGNFWVESVEHRRSPETTSAIRLMRLRDVVFGSPELEEGDG